MSPSIGIVSVDGTTEQPKKSNKLKNQSVGVPIDSLRQQDPPVPTAPSARSDPVENKPKTVKRKTSKHAVQFNDNVAVGQQSSSRPDPTTAKGSKGKWRRASLMLSPPQYH